MAGNESSALDALIEINTNLESVDVNLEPLFQFNNINEISEKLNILSSASLNVSIVYTLLSLYYSKLKLENRLVANHPILGELENIKKYFEKINNIKKRNEASKPAILLNKEATTRLLSQALADDSLEIKKQPKKLKKK